jgi:hypothetical protein
MTLAMEIKDPLGAHSDMKATSASVKAERHEILSRKMWWKQRRWPANIETRGTRDLNSNQRRGSVLHIERNWKIESVY